MTKVSIFHRRVGSLALCLMLIACQPSSGDLIPVAQSNLSLATSRFENDTAQIARDGITVKAYGTWKGSDETDVTVVVNNATGSVLQVDLVKSALINNSSEQAEIAVVKEKKGAAREVIYNPYNASGYKPTTIAANEKQSFTINFRYPYKEASRGVASQTATLRVPIASGRGSENFEFVFQYDNEHVSRSTPDPVD